MENLQFRALAPPFPLIISTSHHINLSSLPHLNLPGSNKPPLSIFQLLHLCTAGRRGATATDGRLTDSYNGSTRPLRTPIWRYVPRRRIPGVTLRYVNVQYNMAIYHFLILILSWGRLLSLPPGYCTQKSHKLFANVQSLVIKDLTVKVCLNT